MLRWHHNADQGVSGHLSTAGGYHFRKIGCFPIWQRPPSSTGRRPPPIGRLAIDRTHIPSHTWTMQGNVLGAVERACARRASFVHLEMGTGITGLATVASTAPFLGIVGTLQGFNYAFRGTVGQRTDIMAAIARDLSEALVLTALGVAVALIAFWGCRHLRSKLEDIDREMKVASL